VSASKLRVEGSSLLARSDRSAGTLLARCTCGVTKAHFNTMGRWQSRASSVSACRSPHAGCGSTRARVLSLVSAERCRTHQANRKGRSQTSEVRNQKLKKRENRKRVNGNSKMGDGIHGVLATRNPKTQSETTGLMLLRYDARQRLESLPQLPPRNTRNVPDDGPCGFTDGLVE